MDFDFDFDLIEVSDPVPKGNACLFYFRYSRYLQYRLVPLYLYLRNLTTDLRSRADRLEQEMEKMEKGSFKYQDSLDNWQNMLRAIGMYDAVLAKVKAVLCHRQPMPYDGPTFFLKMNDWCSGVFDELNYIRNVLINKGSIDM